MIKTEIFSNWYQISIFTSFVTTIALLILKSIKERILVTNTLLFILSATFIYISANAAITIFMGALLAPIIRLFPQLIHSISLFITISGIYLINRLLKLQDSFLRTMALGVLIMCMVASLASAIDSYIHYVEPGSLLLIPLKLTMASGPDHMVVLLILYNLAVLLVYCILLFSIKKIKYSLSIFYAIMFFSLLAKFIFLFFIEDKGIAILSDRLLSLNILQLGILLIITLVGLSIITNERKKSLKTIKFKKIVIPDYILLFIYLSIIHVALIISPVISLQDDYIFLFIFVLTTLSIIVYFFQKISTVYIKSGVTAVVFILASLIVQSNLDNRKEMTNTSPNNETPQRTNFQGVQRVAINKPARQVYDPAKDTESIVSYDDYMIQNTRFSNQVINAGMQRNIPYN